MRHPRFPVLLLVLFTAFSPWVRGEVRPVSRPAPGPVLKVGDDWVYDSGLKITFVEVAADSRRYRPSRPGRGREIAGNALVVLRLEAGNQDPKVVRINTHRRPDHHVIPANEYPPGTAGIPKSYIVSIRKLTPETAGRVGLRAQEVYRLRLKVEVAL